jgi:hypothetical protein
MAGWILPPIQQLRVVLMVMASSSKNLFLVPLDILGGLGVVAVTTIVLLGTLLVFYGNSNQRPIAGIPVIGKQDSERDYTAAKKRWMTSAKDIVNNAVKTVRISHWRPLIRLLRKYV